MKVLLIFPHGEDHIDFPPLGLGYIASALEQAGYQTQIYDASLEQGDINQILMQIELYKPNILGVTVVEGPSSKVKYTVFFPSSTKAFSTFTP